MAEQGTIYNIQRMSTDDGPGLRTTVFFKGCPLRCLWCSNPESQVASPQHMYFADLCMHCGACLDACVHGAVTGCKGGIGRDFSRCMACGACAEVCPTGAAAMSGQSMSVAAVMEVVNKDALFYSNSGGGVTCSGGECTMQGAFLDELVDACADADVHVCLDTCGQCDPAYFARLLPRVDMILFDVKHMDNERHKELVGVGNGLIQRNLRQALASCPEKIRIRVPLMPGLNDDTVCIAALGTLLAEYGVHNVDVLPCHAFGKSKYAALGWPYPKLGEYTPEGLREVLAHFEAHGMQAEVV